MSVLRAIIYMTIFNRSIDDDNLGFILDFQIDYKNLTQSS